MQKLKILEKYIIIILLFIICILLFNLNFKLLDYINNKDVAENIKINTTPTEIIQTETIQPTKEHETFEIGSKYTDVLKIMGTPTDTLFCSDGKEVWYYENSRVFIKDKKVYDYDNENENLKILEEEKVD